jgi:hypothetical protein
MLGNCTQCVPYPSVRRREPTLATGNIGDPALPDHGAMT